MPASKFHNAVCVGLLLGLHGLAGSACAQTLACEPTQKLCQLIDPVDSQDTNLHGVVVELKGQIVAERYFTGRDRLAGNGKSISWIAAMGNGGQRVYAVSAYDLVIAINAGRYNQPHPNNSKPSHDLFLNLLSHIAAQQP